MTIKQATPNDLHNVFLVQQICFTATEAIYTTAQE